MSEITVPTDAQDEWVTIAEFKEPVEAELAAGRLESAGVECELTDGGSELPGAIGQRLRVRATDEVDARLMLTVPEVPQGFTEAGGEEVEADGVK